MDTATVVAAVITSVPATLAAIAAWRKGNKNHKSLGEANGRGNAIKMLTDLQDDVKLVRLQQHDIIKWQVDHLNNHLDRQ